MPIISSINKNNNTVIEKHLVNSRQTDSSPTVDEWLVTGMGLQDWACTGERLEMHFYWWLAEKRRRTELCSTCNLMTAINWEESILCGGKLYTQHIRGSVIPPWACRHTCGQRTTDSRSSKGIRNRNGNGYLLIELDSREIK